ncbi:hypothetical protein ST201phi2-1p170 [Pseudomonas phage 201phi2-1]|uniref:Uncharacterized protein n=1 Tax=Pseudomonas phage 201phi2-1 TaxID=198110 RepID=B3FJ33_BP201|nr:hypothetical protein ST201phi2-1p170 [Pseudomonas phage 201phi2-1]ABY63000.1 hypothetical protein 201phi2-1p170 [Pseudomonas phage 201phi2-1]
MKYGIAAVVGLAALAGVGAWLYNREDEVAKAAEPEVAGAEPVVENEEAI